MGIKADLEIEWADELIDAVCDKAIELIEESKADLEAPEVYLKRCYPQHEIHTPDFYKGFNAGLEDAKMLLEMVKERQD